MKSLTLFLLTLLLALPAFADEPAPPDTIIAADDSTEYGTSCDCQDWQQWHLDVIKARDAQAMWAGDSTFKIAIIGDGLDPDAFELVDNNGSNLWKNAAEVNGTTGVDDDSNGKIDDKWGWDFEPGLPFPEVQTEDNDPTEAYHTGSTFVATIIAGRGPAQAYRGIGVCPRAKVMAIKVWPAGFSGGNLQRQIVGLAYARQMGAKVAYIYSGHTNFNQGFKNELNAWDAAGGLIFCGVDGGAIDYDQYSEGQSIPGVGGYPALYTNACLVVVGGSHYQPQFATQEFYASTCYGANTVDLCAPWDKFIVNNPPAPNVHYPIFSTSIDELWAGWSHLQATAPAQVVGAAALIWSKFPTATAAQVKAALISSANPLDSELSRSKCGGGNCGRVDVYEAYMTLSGGIGETEKAGPVAESPKPRVDDGKRYDVQGRRVQEGAPGVVFGAGRKRVVVTP